MAENFPKTAPEALAPVPFNIPQPFETTLENGLKVVIFEDRRLPLVSYRLAFLTGDAADPKDSVGVTSALVAMLSEGTENYTSKRLAEEIERLGASISVSSSDDFAIVAASALSLYNADILRLMAEMVFAPTFPEDELNLYRRNAIENLKYQRSQASFLANEQSARILYGAHPYGIISPSPADVEKIAREKLIDRHRQVFIPNNAVFVVVGDVDRESLLGEIEDRFGDWEKGIIEIKELPDPPERRERTLTIVDRPGSAQSNIVLSDLAIDRNSPDYFPFLVMNQVLGAGASSRIFMNLREEKGYTYGAYSRMDAKRLAGDFEATAEVRTAVTGDSLKEFFYELNRIRDERVSEQELADAKNFLVGVFPIRAETQEGLTALIVSQQLYKLPADYLQTYRDQVNAVTAEEVERIAQKYLAPDRMAIVIVGDAAEILPQAKSFAAEIEIFDTEGRQQDLSKYEEQPDMENADVEGKWNLSLEFQGQELEIVLKLAQEGDAISGTLETLFGHGKISDGKVKGNRLSATANTEVQGQLVEFSISGTVNDDSLSGTISASIIPVPMDFTGTREK